MIGKVARGGLVGVFLRWASGLRFPLLLALMALLFVADLLVPDVIPLVDEIMLGLATLVLASLKRKPERKNTPDV